jgi:hypothetical protein
MSGIDHTMLLGEDFNLPDNLDIVIVDSLAALERHAAHIHSPGNHQMFGSAFVQGERLNFTTAVPWALMLAIGVVEQARQGADLEEVLQKSNRPKQGAHGANLRKYLKETACHHEKFIVPSMTMNCGATFGGEEIRFKATLIIVANDGKTLAHGCSSWSAMLIIPSHIRLHITDGGHRSNQSSMIVNDNGDEVTEAMKSALLSNAIDLRFVFEPDSDAAHQDFADCGRAKPIAASQITAYDRRDHVNSFTAKLVSGIPFLAAQVDATAAGVNLSAKSIKCWPMSAVRMMIDIINRAARDREVAEEGLAPAFDDDRFDDFDVFIDKLVAKVPTLKVIFDGWLAVEQRQKARDEVQTAADLRGIRGGDLVLRASFLAIVARAYDYCRVNDYSLETMAQHLADTDWHVLDCTTEELDALIQVDKQQAAVENREPKTYQEILFAHVTPYLRPLIVAKEGRYRLTASGPEITVAWEMLRVRYGLPKTEHRLAAE